MIVVPRAVLAFFTLLFALQYPVLGVFWLAEFQSQGLAILCMAFYVLAILPSVVLYRSINMPTGQVLVNFVVAVVVPMISFTNLEANERLIAGTYATWFVGGVGTLLAITAMRGGALWSWIGLLLLLINVVVWGGAGAINTTGLIGAFAIVGAAYAIARGYNSTTDQMRSYLVQASSAASQTARTTAIRTERKVRVQAALRGALPILQRIIDNGGKLKAEDKVEALLTEAALRDEIHGKALIDDGVRIAAREARKRGVEVSIVDDGGMDAADQFGALAIRTSIAQAIASTAEGTISIRSPKNETFMVSITAHRPGATHPDLWLRLP